MVSSPVIMWFGQDLRLQDNPALHHAACTGAPLVALYILDDTAAGEWAMGGASRWWLHHSLSAMAESLRTLGVPLILRRGNALEVLESVISETGASALFWNRRYEPFHIFRDKNIKAALQQRDLTVESFNGTLLFEPWVIRNKQNEPFKVFTPFWKACLQAPPPENPLPRPQITPFSSAVKSDALEQWQLLPTAPDWAAGLRESWKPGETGAQAQWRSFVKHGLPIYAASRDVPSAPATSRLSPHLHFGEISLRQLWHQCHLLASAGGGEAMQKNIDKFLSELGWREFSYQLLFHFPELPAKPWKQEFSHFPWQENKSLLKAWQRGHTGYPIIDAGMRELWHTGSMHNRVRMIAASFLIKHLLIHWHEGARWFWDTLVDADLASNSASWQWVAGSGADAAPYFRIFNPVLQGQKFDAKGEYIKRWVPELAQLPQQYIHAPWQAPEAVLAQADIALGSNYPLPIVEHDKARRRALAAYKTITSKA